MSFWESYERIATDRRFQPIRSELVPVPELITYVGTEADIPELTAFLTNHFGDARHPILKPILNPEQELILFTRGADKSIQATIRHKYAGTFEGQRIYLIDCFCSKERRTGIATRLLATLQRRIQDPPYALFLKEGRPVFGQDPLYTSSYMYRRRRSNSQTCLSLTNEEAYALVNTYRRIYKDLFWLADVHNPNQHWRLWKRGALWSLACFQDSFQEKEGLRIGWMTAFIANTPTGIEALVDSCPFPWIWADQRWIKETDPWSLDGPFHWYAYRWTTSLTPLSIAGLALGCYGIIV